VSGTEASGAPAARTHGRRRAAPARRRSRAPLALAAAIALVLGAGASASALFLDRATAGAQVGAGTVVAEFDATGVTTVQVPVTDLLPGGTARRLVDLTNAGTVSMGALQLESAATTVGASASDGLQLALERCSVAWSSDAATCPGTTTTVAADRPATARIDLPASPAFAIGATDHLRLTLRLPESSPSTAQSTSGTLTLAVLGVQAPGKHR
jgi:hypothetical protein